VETNIVHSSVHSSSLTTRFIAYNLLSRDLLDVDAKVIMLTMPQFIFCNYKIVSSNTETALS